MILSHAVLQGALFMPLCIPTPASGLPYEHTEGWAATEPHPNGILKSYCAEEQHK